MIRDAQTPAMAKKLGRAVQLTDDWDARRLGVMRELIRLKFNNPLLRAMLLATGDATITHVNSWNDRVFGVCRGTGQDWLGRILMEVRDECRRDEQLNSP